VWGKFQKPKTKSQTNSKSLNFKFQRAALRVGIWSLDFVWDLGFGIWIFPCAAHPVGFAAGIGTFFKYCHAIKAVTKASTAQVTYGIAGLI